MEACDVLVVDDDGDIRDAVSDLLTDAGLTVRTAIHGRDGLRLLTQVRPAVIMLDSTMPEMTGPEMLEHLTADSDLAKIPVLNVTAGALGPLIPAAMSKPFDGDALVRRIER